MIMSVLLASPTRTTTITALLTLMVITQGISSFTGAEPHHQTRKTKIRIIKSDLDSEELLNDQEEEMYHEPRESEFSVSTTTPEESLGHSMNRTDDRKWNSELRKKIKASEVQVQMESMRDGSAIRKGMEHRVGFVPSKKTFRKVDIKKLCQNDPKFKILAATGTSQMAEIGMFQSILLGQHFRKNFILLVCVLLQFVFWGIIVERSLDHSKKARIALVAIEDDKKLTEFEKLIRISRLKTKMKENLMDRVDSIP